MTEEAGVPQTIVSTTASEVLYQRQGTVPVAETPKRQWFSGQGVQARGVGE
jgi:hypothetical protein